MVFLSEQSALYVVVLVCLALVLMMAITLILMFRRSATAEKQVKEMAAAVQEKLAQADETGRENSAQARKELSETVQNVNDSVMRMMGEMTRTQQGQMDALGGQLRAAGRQEEERMEHMRQTMDRRLSAYEERIGGVNQALEEKLGSNEVVGYAKPRRSYKAVELQIDRAWDGKWSFNASYLWSKSEGNHEGPVNSDTNYGDTGMVQHWDHPAGNARYGVLFNDRRHQIKLRSTYAFNENWSVGGTLSAASGGPITAFGVAWPGDSRGAASFVTEGSGGGSAWRGARSRTI